MSRQGQESTSMPGHIKGPGSQLEIKFKPCKELAV
jgi:hypothetical protein